MILALLLVILTVSHVQAEEAPSPKYVFMFIGDGMGSLQISASQYYLGTLQNRAR